MIVSPKSSEHVAGADAHERASHAQERYYVMEGMYRRTAMWTWEGVKFDEMIIVLDIVQEARGVLTTVFLHDNSVRKFRGVLVSTCWNPIL